MTSRARPHTQGATSWLSKSEFPGFPGYVSQILYSILLIPVPYGRGGAREPVLNLVPGHDGHGHIYGHGYGHFLKEITKVVSGQWSVPADSWAVRSVGQCLWSVYTRFCYCGQGQWSEVRETDRTTLLNLVCRCRRLSFDY